VAEAARAANAVEVRLGVLGEVEVDDDIDGLDIDTAREQVCVPQETRRVAIGRHGERRSDQIAKKGDWLRKRNGFLMGWNVHAMTGAPPHLIGDYGVENPLCATPPGGGR
jgi:hypothetical protein